MRAARLRPINGRDEAFLLETGETLPPAARATGLLSRCLLRVGAEEAVTPRLVRSLTVGDREALLLHLRRATFGNRLTCVLRCPRSDCGSKMDLELKVSDLLVPPYANPQETYEYTLSLNEKEYRVSFQLPTGEAQELAADRARTEFEDAEKLLMRLCITDVAEANSGPLDAEQWPAELTDRMGEKMAELDPQAEIDLHVRCPTCDEPFTAELDTGAYLYEELRGRVPHLYREIHQIASSYHWSEADILSMTPKKRMMYLGLLAGEDCIE